MLTAFQTKMNTELMQCALTPNIKTIGVRSGKKPSDDCTLNVCLQITSLSSFYIDNNLLSPAQLNDTGFNIMTEKAAAVAVHVS